MNESSMHPAGKKALLIVNPVSGRKLIQRYMTQLVRGLMDEGYLVTTAVTAQRGEARELSRLLGGQFELLVCAGGDGTMNECVSGLVDAGLQIPVGYIPCGSTNVAEGALRRFDLGSFDEQLFIHHALFGAFTWMAYSTDQEQKNKLGYGAYILDGLRDLSKLKPISLRLTTETETVEGDYLFGSVCTDRHIAGVFELPEELIGPEDGQLAAVLIRAPKTVLELESLAHCL